MRAATCPSFRHCQVESLGLRPRSTSPRTHPSTPAWLCPPRHVSQARTVAQALEAQRGHCLLSEAFGAAAGPRGRAKARTNSVTLCDPRRSARGRAERGAKTRLAQTPDTKLLPLVPGHKRCCSGCSWASLPLCFLSKPCHFMPPGTCPDFPLPGMPFPLSSVHLATTCSCCRACSATSEPSIVRATPHQLPPDQGPAQGLSSVWYTLRTAAERQPRAGAVSGTVLYQESCPQCHWHCRALTSTTGSSPGGGVSAAPPPCGSRALL